MTGWGWVAFMWAMMGVNWWLLRRVEREREEVRAMLGEIRRCNEDFEESLALVRYGAFAEAEEVASRWRKRLAADPDCGARGVNMKIKRGGA